MNKKISDVIKSLDNMLMQELLENFSEYNLFITPIQGSIICYLINNQDKDICQKNIEELFCIRRSTASEVLKLMEKNNLITRVISEGDLRKRNILLTDNARLLHKKIEKLTLNLEKNMSRNITQEELHIFYNVIEKIKSNIREMK